MADAGPVVIDGTEGLIVNSWIGVGTPVPEHALHVKGFFKLEGADFIMAEPTRGDGGRALVHGGSGTDDQLILNYGRDFEEGIKLEGSKLTVDGKVGMETTNPLGDLHVKGSGGCYWKDRPRFRQHPIPRR